jgi:hypothetical protein
MITYVALTQAEYDDVLSKQQDPEKLADLMRAGDRRSGDKIYVESRLIDGLRLNWYYIAPGVAS